MCPDKYPTYVLQELSNLTESINFPLKSTQRIRYTCFDVSKTLIAFGATSGGIYVFSRNPCEFVQLIPSKDGTITRLTISPNEQQIAFANGRGVVTVTECAQVVSHKSVCSKEHTDNEVTSMVWSKNMLFIGDDTGKISVLQLPNFITKTIFQSYSQMIMHLDSRICQLDIKENMLLVSTLTRCFICDTAEEQYRQIGQKLRDGEYGACFVTSQKTVESNGVEENSKDYTEVRKFSIADDSDKTFAVNTKLVNTAIFSARPSSRLWEASIDGTVKRTHQYKQVLARKPFKVISLESYTNENVSIEKVAAIVEGTNGQSCNFPKIFNMRNGIFSFRKDALYFLDTNDVNKTIWTDTYDNIVDCKMYYDILYLWLQNGGLIMLQFMKIDKLMVKCFLDSKFNLCAELCALYSDYLLTNNVSHKLHIISNLRDKVQDRDVIDKIEAVLAKFDALKCEATQTKSGIYVVDNTYHTQALLSDNEDVNDEDYSSTPQEPLQTLKDLSISMTDKINTSKKILKEKWEGFEEKMKHLGENKTQKPESDPTFNIATKKITHPTNENSITEVEQIAYDNDIVYRNSSQTPAIDQENEEINSINTEKNRLSKSLYQHFRLSLVTKEADDKNLLSLIDENVCDIKELHQLLLQLQEYCITIGALEESKYASNNIFLEYLTLTPKRDELLDEIINEEVLYKYFIESCIVVNTRTQKLSRSGCECGFPLPYTKSNETPLFSEIIDQFMEKQWSNHTKDQCYDMCRKMPHLWKKILYLRRNEDLMNILQLLLQMLDENLLHSYLPHFTIEAWEKTVQLYSILHANKCLNCNRSFDNISVEQTLNWDDLGCLIIKSVGGRNAIKIMERNSELISPGELSIKFYHTCLLVCLYEKYDAIITNQLADTLYKALDDDVARNEINNILRTSIKGNVKNTALPIMVAIKSKHWGLSNIYNVLYANKTEVPGHINEQINLEDVLSNLSSDHTDCVLCGLPLSNKFLIDEGGLWVFKCGHIFHGACLDLNQLKLCTTCSVNY